MIIHEQLMVISALTLHLSEFEGERKFPWMKHQAAAKAKGDVATNAGEGKVSDLLDYIYFSFQTKSLNKVKMQFDSTLMQSVDE